MSSYWYTDFVDTYNEDVGYMFLWLIGLPYVLFISQVVSSPSYISNYYII